MFQRAAEGKRGAEALEAMGDAYVERLLTDRDRLRARCRPTPPVTTRRSARSCAHGYGDLVAYVERVSGLPAAERRALLRQGHAAERVRVDGLVGGDPSRGPSGCSPAAGRPLTLFFSRGGK